MRHNGSKIKGKLVIIIIQIYCNANNNSSSKCMSQLIGLDKKQLNTTTIIKMISVYWFNKDVA